MLQSMGEYKGAAPTSAADIIPRFVSNLRLPNELEKLAVQIAVASASDLQGRVYTSVAGAAIYMAYLLCYGLPVTQGVPPRTAKDISEATGAAEATIRQVYREMHGFRHRLFAPGADGKGGLPDFIPPGRLDAIPDH
mmetsp:Transcript_44317/g.118250  ORF Transcript_44317/g.118250 Transcript_44317/m.118250 type:complete len:137 (+) Transcript_44317:304-714(+)